METQQFLTQQYNKTLAYFATATPGKRWLDLGCGKWKKSYWEICRPSILVGMDVDPVIIAQREQSKIPDNWITLWGDFRYKWNRISQAKHLEMSPKWFSQYGWNYVEEEQPFDYILLNQSLSFANQTKAKLNDLLSLITSKSTTGSQLWIHYLNLDSALLSKMDVGEKVQFPNQGYIHKRDDISINIYLPWSMESEIVEYPISEKRLTQYLHTLGWNKSSGHINIDHLVDTSPNLSNVWQNLYNSHEWSIYTKR